MKEDRAFSCGFRLIAIIIVLSISVFLALALFGCNDNNAPVYIPPKPVDSTKPEPVILPAFATVNEAIKGINYITAAGIRLEMKEGDNYQYLQETINSGEGIFIIPNGRFLISNTLVIPKTKSITLVGSGSTVIDVQAGHGAVKVLGGLKLYNVKFSSNPTIGSANGIEVHGVSYLYDVWVHGFAGKGFSITADVEAAQSNASHSQLLFCTASECGDDGLYLQGGDANACNVIGFDARDNSGYGIYDNSFLGNTFINAMCHSNKKGHYRADNGNNRSVFLGCYAEQDSPPSIYGGQCVVIGGLQGWEVNQEKTFYKGTDIKYSGYGGYVITSPHVQVIGK